MNFLLVSPIAKRSSAFRASRSSRVQSQRTCVPSCHGTTSISASWPPSPAKLGSPPAEPRVIATPRADLDDPRPDPSHVQTPPAFSADHLVRLRPACETHVLARCRAPKVVAQILRSKKWIVMPGHEKYWMTSHKKTAAILASGSTSNGLCKQFGASRPYP